MTTISELRNLIHNDYKVNGFSTQDIAHIGLRLTHIGNLAWIVEGTEYAKNGCKDMKVGGK